MNPEEAKDERPEPGTWDAEAPDQIERAAKAYYDATFDTDHGEGAEYGPYDEPWERAPTSYKKDVRAKMEIVLRAAWGE